MRAYWSDYELLLRRVNAAAGSRLVVIQVEPDLWGYLEQAHAVRLARSFARRLIALRDRLAPHAELAYHLSVWGTDYDLTNSKPSPAQVDRMAAESAAFYESLHARFDLVFNDVTDRDAGYYQYVEGDPRTWWGPADFARENRYIAGFTRRTHTAVVLWQLPVGDTSLNDTWGHYRDNRLQWWLGAGGTAHLRATRDAGVIGLLFGAGAAGCTTPQSIAPPRRLPRSGRCPSLPSPRGAASQPEPDEGAQLRIARRGYAQQVRPGGRHQPRRPGPRREDHCLAGGGECRREPGCHRVRELLQAGRRLAGAVEDHDIAQLKRL
jgi:hypothetical protein